MYYFDKNYAVHIPMRDDWHNNNVSLNDDIACFTDGSRLTHVGSSGSRVNVMNSQEEYCFFSAITALFIRLRYMLS